MMKYEMANPRITTPNKIDEISKRFLDLMLVQALDSLIAGVNILQKVSKIPKVVKILLQTKTNIPLSLEFWEINLTHVTLGNLEIFMIFGAFFP